MEISNFVLTLNETKGEALKQAINKRFGYGYFGLNCGITVSEPTDERYEKNIQFDNFNSVSGWATIGGLRWDDKKQKWIISFKGKGLGKTGKYS